MSGTCDDLPVRYMHVHAFHILLLTWSRFMRAWITFAMQMPLCCASLAHTETCSSLSVCWGGTRGALLKAELVTDTLEVSSLWDPRLAFAKTSAGTSHGRKGGEHGGGEGGEKTRRHNWLSFFLLHWSCEKGRIYNACTHSRIYKDCLQLYIIFPGVKCLCILSTIVKTCIFNTEWLITQVSQREIH